MNQTSIRSFYDAFAYMHEVSGGAFGMLVLGIIFIAVFTMYSSATTTRRLLVASFISMVTAVMLSVMSLIGPEIMFISVISTGAFAWLTYNENKQ